MSKTAAATNNALNLLDFVDDHLKVNFQQYDSYEIFGISLGATDDEIKKAYHKLSAKYHPDKNGGSDKAQALFTTLTQIKDALLNAQQRTRYNSYLKLTPKYQAAALEEKMTMALNKLNADYEKNHNNKNFLLDVEDEISKISGYIHHPSGKIEHKITNKYFSYVFTENFDITNFLTFTANIKINVANFCEKISTWAKQKKEPSPSIKRDAAQADLDEADLNDDKLKNEKPITVQPLKRQAAAATEIS